MVSKKKSIAKTEEKVMTFDAKKVVQILKMFNLRLSETLAKYVARDMPDGIKSYTIEDGFKNFRNDILKANYSENFNTSNASTQFRDSIIQIFLENMRRFAGLVLCDRLCDNCNRNHIIGSTVEIIEKYNIVITAIKTAGLIMRDDCKSTDVIKFISIFDKIHNLKPSEYGIVINFLIENTNHDELVRELFEAVKSLDKPNVDPTELKKSSSSKSCKK